MSAVQVINDEKGNPTHVVIPHAKWLAMKQQLEDISDARRADKAIAEYEAGGRVSFPQEVVDKLFEGEASPLAVIRKWRNLTQAQLAELVDSDRVYIANIERGARPAGRKLQKSLAEALNVDRDIIFPDD